MPATRLPGSGLRLDAAILVALFMESVFYGLFLVTFGICIRVLVFQKGISTRRSYLLIVVLLLFGIATSNIAFSVRHVLDAFVWYNGPGGPLVPLVNISNRVNAMKTVNYVIQTIIGDAMLVYRLYAVYGHDWRIVVFPAMLWVTSIVLGAKTCQITFALKDDALLDAKRLVPFVTSALSVTMALNVIATSLILLRLWLLQRRSPRVGVNDGIVLHGSLLRRITLILIESAAMYTTSVLVFFIVYTCSDNAYYAIADSIVQIIGIAFNFIIVRTYQGWTVSATTIAPLTSHINVVAGETPVSTLGEKDLEAGGHGASLNYAGGSPERGVGVATSPH